MSSEPKVTDHGGHGVSGHGVPQVGASETAMRTSVREPARSPQDAVPRDRLQPKSWLKLTLESPNELSDPIASMLSAISDSGVEYGYTNFGTDSDREEISIYLLEDGEIEEKIEAIDQFLRQLRKSNPERHISPFRRERIADCDWNAAWKKEFIPFSVAPGLIIKPSWEPYSPGAGEVVLEMDPGQAFGTGHHASTRLALQLLKPLFHPTHPANILDVGCGTGILAMAAALWGTKRVVAIDNDPQAVSSAKENIARNNFNKLITASNTPLAEVQDSFEVVVANIILEVLLELAPDLVARTKPGGKIILAGILAGDQEEQIKEKFLTLGVRPQKQSHEGEWAALLLM